jgi:hypothetical protein
MESAGFPCAQAHMDAVTAIRESDMSIFGFLTGLAEAKGQEQRTLFEREMDRRKQLGDLYLKFAMDPGIREEGRGPLLQRAVSIYSHPPEKKLPKEFEDITPLLTTNVPVGQLPRRDPSVESSQVDIPGGLLPGAPAVPSVPSRTAVRPGEAGPGEQDIPGIPALPPLPALGTQLTTPELEPPPVPPGLTRQMPTRYTPEELARMQAAATESEMAAKLPYEIARAQASRPPRAPFQLGRYGAYDPETGKYILPPPGIEDENLKGQDRYYHTLKRIKMRELGVDKLTDEQDAEVQLRAEKNFTPADARIKELQLQLAEQRLQSGDLPPKIASRVDQMVKAFDTSALVKRFNTIAEAVAFTRGIPEDRSNSAWNISMLYAFAKANDPESVVREGEYATVQRYAQSWLQTFGFNVQRIFENKEFLSPEAVRNMKAVIESKAGPVRIQYDAYKKTIMSNINRATGKGDAEDRVTPYEAILGETPQPSAAPRKKRYNPATGKIE